MSEAICKNCGGWKGIHHYETMQCPVGGTEAPIGRKQEWMSTTFQDKNEVFTRDEVQAMIDEAIQKHVENFDHVDFMEAHDY